MRKILKDLTGLVFGKLTVIRSIGVVKHSRVWECRCECGTYVYRATAYLLWQQKRGAFQACKDCVSHWRTHQSTTHGQSRKPLYRIWCNMRSVCNNPNNPYYLKYKEQGITVCNRWQIFENFFRDVFDLYKPGLHLCRIDKTKGFLPGNVRFSSKTDQLRGRARKYAIDAAALSKASGVPVSTIYYRMAHGWPEHLLTRHNNRGQRHLHSQQEYHKQHKNEAAV